MTTGAVGGVASTGVSRPGSAHSAPLLDLSIDRHYEFDAARTPTGTNAIKLFTAVILRMFVIS
jgi:hypothetical protein